MIKFDFLRDPCDYLPWQEHRKIFDFLAKRHRSSSLTNPRASLILFHRRVNLLINKVTWPKEHPSKSRFFRTLEYEIFVPARLLYFIVMSGNVDTSKKDFRKKLFPKRWMSFANYWC